MKKIYCSIVTATICFFVSNAAIANSSNCNIIEKLKNLKAEIQTKHNQKIISEGPVYKHSGELMDAVSQSIETINLGVGNKLTWIISIDLANNSCVGDYETYSDNDRSR